VSHVGTIFGQHVRDGCDHGVRPRRRGKFSVYCVDADLDLALLTPLDPGLGGASIEGLPVGLDHAIPA
jgi:hypothetical protein